MQMVIAYDTLICAIAKSVVDTILSFLLFSVLLWPSFHILTAIQKSATITRTKFQDIDMLFFFFLSPFSNSSPFSWQLTARFLK